MSEWSGLANLVAHIGQQVARDDMRAQGHFILVDTDSVRRALDGDGDA